MLFINNPQDADAYYNRGVFYSHQGQASLALADFNQAISINPHHADAYNSRGFLYAQQGQTELALADYNQAIDLDPNFAMAYSNLGLLYMKLDDIKAARANLQKAQQVHNLQGNTAQASRIAEALKSWPRLQLR